MSPDDHARQLIADSDNWIIEQGKRDGVPVGFTWAQLVRSDTEDFDSYAIDRANGLAFEQLLTQWAGEDEDGEHWNHVGGYLVVKILDEQGQVTQVGRQAAEVMCGLADYPVISEEVLSEIESEGFDHDWGLVERELKGGYFNQNGGAQLDLGDGLKTKQIQKAFDRYRETLRETPRDDRGYQYVDRRTFAEALYELGYVVPEDNPRRPGLSPMLAQLRNDWGPLSAPARQQVLGYLDAPSLAGWRLIRTKIIVPEGLRRTLWQWVLEVDPGFASEDHGGPLAEFPDPFTVARALRAAAEARRRGLT